MTMVVRCPIAVYRSLADRLDRLGTCAQQNGTGAHGSGSLFLAHAPFRCLSRQSAADAHDKRSAGGPVRCKATIRTAIPLGHKVDLNGRWAQLSSPQTIPKNSNGVSPWHVGR